jgi:hypothetical protein
MTAALHFGFRACRTRLRGTFCTPLGTNSVSRELLGWWDGCSQSLGHTGRSSAQGQHSRSRLTLLLMCFSTYWRAACHGAALHSILAGMLGCLGALLCTLSSNNNATFQVVFRSHLGVFSTLTARRWDHFQVRRRPPQGRRAARTREDVGRPAVLVVALWCSRAACTIEAVRGGRQFP